MSYMCVSRCTGSNARVRSWSADSLREAQRRAEVEEEQARAWRESKEGRAIAERLRADQPTPEEREEALRESCRRNLDSTAKALGIRPHAARLEGLTLEERASMLAYLMADSRMCSKHVAQTIAGQAEAGDLVGAVRGIVRVRRAAMGW